MLKIRINNIDGQLTSLDAEFRGNLISSDQFVERQTSLKKTREVLLDELHRLGVIH
jgi:hypothetical protein